MNSSLIDQIDADIATHEQELSRLRAARAALSGGTPPAPAAPSSPAAPIPGPLVTKAGADRKRAPAGFLRAAVLKQLAAAPGSEMSVKQLRKALAAAKYPFLLGDLPKTMQEMAKEGLLTMKPNGPWSTYRPTKKALKR